MRSCHVLGSMAWEMKKRKRKNKKTYNLFSLVSYRDVHKHMCHEAYYFLSGKQNVKETKGGKYHMDRAARTWD